MIDDIFIQPNDFVCKIFEKQFLSREKACNFTKLDIPDIYLQLGLGDYEDPAEAEVEGKIIFQAFDETNMLQRMGVSFFHAKNLDEKNDYQAWKVYKNYMDHNSIFLKTLAKLLNPYNVRQINVHDYDYLNPMPQLIDLPWFFIF